ncbi:MAG: hypothetical protein UX60_C0034G0011 [Berkelbacteria bacterium GW2011_GWA2_46_7]|uniref:Uncharacterized protein n=1 Tax=Berkelbacteria bacterium GW2011_GWA2_46_7 TaxID=1618335 RepID=A0A0G1QDW7_9BACT|nr:MAG: hypothetical protein UX60_C0034G0011 [Berkelbacteria bacterium GW2011_GWA2_46_7]
MRAVSSVTTRDTAGRVDRFKSRLEKAKINK